MGGKNCEGAAVIAALVSLTAAGAAERPATPWLVAGPIVGAVALGVSWWWTALVWRAWRVRIGDDALHLRHGVLTRHESTIPYHRIQHIDLEAGPLERRLRLTSLILRTASATSDATVPGIDDEEAGRVRTRILARAGDGDAV